MEPHELMTTEEVAEHFRVNPSTVRRWRLDGVGPRFVKIGSVYRYPRVHLSEWIAARIGDRVAS
jgi:excisionase family DNA binding protein